MINYKIVLLTLLVVIMVGFVAAPVMVHEASAQFGSTGQSRGISSPIIPVDEGRDITSEGQLEQLLRDVASLLIRIGSIVAVIGLAISAILYFVAASGDFADTAKGWLKNVVIGAIILFGIGIILQFAESIGTLSLFN